MAPKQPPNPLRALVVGGGSIGLRHFRNLKALNVHTVGILESDADCQKALEAEGINVFPAIESALASKPDFAVIAVPTHLHVQIAAPLVQNGIHVFIEKPLSHTIDGIEDLASEAERRKLVTLVGCNMRFHPGPAKVKELIVGNKVGRIHFAQLQCGSFLPEWRPNRDYRKLYSSRSDMGGGCVLDGIHEIDLARWFLGDVKEVFCRTEKISSLEIDVEDMASIVCKHESGPVSEIHLDYFQRTYERGCRIVGENGTIFWDFRQKQVRWYDAATDQWTNFEQKPDWDTNQMYLDEMRHFIQCVQDRKPSTHPISEAIEVTRIALAAKSSSQSRTYVTPGGKAA